MNLQQFFEELLVLTNDVYRVTAQHEQMCHVINTQRAKIEELTHERDVLRDLDIKGKYSRLMCEHNALQDRCIALANQREALTREVDKTREELIKVRTQLEQTNNGTELVFLRNQVRTQEELLSYQSEQIHELAKFRNDLIEILKQHQAK